MRVLVLGTGAMGTAVAGLLSHHTRAEVTVGGRWPAAIEALRERGAIVEGPLGSLVGRVRAQTLDEIAPSSADAVIVLVKAYRTASIASLAARARSETGLVLTLQNGLGSVDVLASAVGTENLAAGVATFGATLLGPGRVRHFPGGLALGADEATALRLAPLATILSAAHLAPSISPDLERVLWTKLAINCGVNPVAALHRLENGALLALPEARFDLLAAATEVAAVAAKRGIHLTPHIEEVVTMAVLRTAGNINSMLQDVLRGIPTEIESMNGAIVREAQRLGVSVPVNERLLAAVRALDATCASPKEASPC